jgi:translation initiation factor IF-2
MSELKLPRLLAAAKEFNIGQDTLIDFLAKKGFNKDELKPSAKLSEDMYYALQTEFQSDKAAKTKADQIEIPKSVLTDKKKKEEEPTIKKEEKKPEKTEKVEAVKEEEPTPAPVVVEEKIIEETKAAPPVKEIVTTSPEIVIAPKVIDKIDLSAIDSSTRPKKTAKPKPTEPTKETKESKKTESTKEEKVKEEIKEQPVVTKEEPKPIIATDTTPQATSIVENIEVEKIIWSKNMWVKLHYQLTAIPDLKTLQKTNIENAKE